ncbi:MAG: hypothetical protein A2Y16_05180 [Tenericutes bacterium GWF2_57_13]|nr:MAG: hypothetical protein A2Y16_05180 [Tenericutes bacterium GWF2_57_13]
MTEETNRSWEAVSQEDSDAYKATIRKNVLRWSGSPLTIVFAVLLSAVLLYGGLHASALMPELIPTGFVEVFAFASRWGAIGFPAITLLGLWLVVFNRFLVKVTSFGFWLLRFMALMHGIQYCLFGVFIIVFSIIAMFTDFWNGLLSLVVYAGLIYFGIRFLIRIRAFIAELEMAAESRLIHHPDPTGVPGYLFAFAGIEVLGAFFFWIDGRSIETVADLFGAVDIVTLCLNAVLHLFAAFLLLRYYKDVTKVPLHRQ